MADIDMVAAAWKVGLIGLVVVIEQFCGGMATAAQMIFIMRRCHPDHKAAHYAFATAVYSTAQMAIGGYSGHVYENVGPVSYFWIVSALTIPAVLLARFVPKD
jgi:PAT family beta-lactamase induction signal transducer AmpG